MMRDYKGFIRYWKKITIGDCKGFFRYWRNRTSQCWGRGGGCKGFITYWRNKTTMRDCKIVEK